MNTLLARADLVRIAASLGEGGLLAIAPELGYALVEEQPEQPELPAHFDERRPERQVDAEPQPSAEEALLPVRFWQPQSVEFHGPGETLERVRAAEQAELEAESSQPWEGGKDEPPESPPLSPWRRLGPLLQRALSEEQLGHGVDIPRLVREVVRGRHVARFPRPRRRRWAPVEIIVDRAYRLAPFWDDQRRVIRELVSILGAQRVSTRVLANGPTEGSGEYAGLMQGRGRRRVPVLALSDLGIYGGKEERAAWLRLGTALRAVGEQVIALVPAPRSRWPSGLADVWAMIPWERPAVRLGERAGVSDASDGHRSDGDSESDGELARRESEERRARAERLLLYLSPALRIERGLLRTIRGIIPRSEADVAVEADVWAHPALGEMFPEYRVMDPAVARRLRADFAATVPADDQARIMAALRAWHWNRARLPEAWHLEVLLASRTLGRTTQAKSASPIERREVEDAEAFMAWFAGPALRGALDVGEAETLRRWCHFVAEQTTRSLWDPSSAVGRSLQTIAFRVGGIDVPDADPRVAEMVGPPRRRTPSEYTLYQVGGGLVTSVDDSITRGCSTLATVIAADPRLFLSSAAVDDGAFMLDRPGSLKAPPTESVTLRTDRTTLRLSAIEKPSWARAIGRDGYGLWAELFVKGVAYRMRWIPPGRFVMGSPEEEPGRYEDEGPQHEVTITRGFWLGETPVTQALWEAVMGENPSHFKTPDRPVEQVSWEDCQGEGGLMERLHRALDPEEGVGGEALGRFRLPTEAEWEYACRAGTRTATYAGRIEILGERNAPVLDAIAWYGGNSGVEYDLDEGVDSSEWPEKQHEHSKAGTRRVAQKLANAWGLHDMLGNVWEWCMDRRDPSSGYASEPQQDPSGPATGGSRVIRGGAWSNHARNVRAAYRFAFHPSYRYDFLGLRLARDQGGRVGPEGPGGPDPEGLESPEGYALIVFGRERQWDKLLQECSDSDDNLLIIVHGGHKQDVDLFLMRMKQYLRNEIRTRREHDYFVVSRTFEHTAITGLDWAQRVTSSTALGGNLRDALDHCTREQAAVFVFQDYDHPLHGLDKAAFEGLVALFTEEIGPTVAKLRLRHPLRFVLPFEHGTDDNAFRRRIKKAATQLASVPGLRLVELDELLLPSFEELLTQIKRDYPALHDALLPQIKDLWVKFSDVDRTPEQSIRVLGGRLQKLLRAAAERQAR